MEERLVLHSSTHLRKVEIILSTRSSCVYHDRPFLFVIEARKFDSTELFGIEATVHSSKDNIVDEPTEEIGLLLRCWISHESQCGQVSLKRVIGRSMIAWGGIAVRNVLALSGRRVER